MDAVDNVNVIVATGKVGASCNVDNISVGGVASGLALDGQEIRKLR